MHVGVGYQGPGRYQVEFTDGMLGEVMLSSHGAFLGALHHGVEVYVHGNTDGRLGFSLKKLKKRIVKVVKKVASPVTKITEKILKPIMTPLRPVLARVAALTPVGLIAQPKMLGIKDASSQKAFTNMQRVVRTAGLGPLAQGVAILSSQKSSAPRGVVTGAAVLLPEGPPPETPSGALPISIFEPQPSSSAGPVAIPGWESAGGGGGMMPSPEQQPEATPEEATKPEEKKGGGVLILGLLAAGLYALSGGK
jgi:hypothetical protein